MSSYINVISTALCAASGTSSTSLTGSLSFVNY